MMQRFLRFLLLVSALVAIAAMEPPSQPILVPPEQAAKEGRAVVNEMLSLMPDENATTGMMAIRKNKPTSSYTEFPIRFQTIVTRTNWISVYQATRSNKVEIITIIHALDQPNIYYFGPNPFISVGSTKTAHDSLPPALSSRDILAPFTGSDFSIADLGIEFLHWPDQKLLQKEMKRSRSCRVLESTNPHPEKGGYSKVKSWIVDDESHGILLAQAFDAKGKQVKEFEPQDFSKATGQWQLEKMQIRNLQTGSATTVKFNLK